MIKPPNDGRGHRDEGSDELWPAVLQYWRSIPAEAFDDTIKAEVTAFMRATTSTIPEWRRAISGDAATAIAMVAHCKEPTSIGVKIDFPMTVLLSCTFDHPAAALVLSHNLRQMPLEPRLRAKLAMSWRVAANLRSSSLRRATRRNLRRGGEA